MYILSDFSVYKISQVITITTTNYRPDNISWRFCLHQRAPTYLLSILTAFRWMGALLHVCIREGTHLKSLPI